MQQVTAATAISAKQTNAVQLVALGWTRNRVATQLGIDPGTLSRWRRQPAFQFELGKLLEQSERESREAFRAIKLLAVERLAGLVNSSNLPIALKAVEMVLSRTDLCTVQVVSTGSCQERSDAQFDKILDELFTA